MEILALIFEFLIVIGLFLIQKELAKMHANNNKWLKEIHEAIEANREWLKEINDKIPEK